MNDFEKLKLEVETSISAHEAWRKLLSVILFACGAALFSEISKNDPNPTIVIIEGLGTFLLSIAVLVVMCAYNALVHKVRYGEE